MYLGSPRRDTKVTDWRRKQVAARAAWKERSKPWRSKPVYGKLQSNDSTTEKERLWYYIPNSMDKMTITLCPKHHQNSAGYAEMCPDVSCYLFPLHILATLEWSNSQKYQPSIWPCSWCPVLLIPTAFGRPESISKFLFFPLLNFQGTSDFCRF